MEGPSACQRAAGSREIDSGRGGSVARVIVDLLVERLGRWRRLPDEDAASAPGGAGALLAAAADSPLGTS